MFGIGIFLWVCCLWVCVFCFGGFHIYCSMWGFVLAPVLFLSCIGILYGRVVLVSGVCCFLVVG